MDEKIKALLDEIDDHIVDLESGTCQEFDIRGVTMCSCCSDAETVARDISDCVDKIRDLLEKS